MLSARRLVVPPTLLRVVPMLPTALLSVAPRFAAAALTLLVVLVFAAVLAAVSSV
jgi:hypothetical protein